MLTIETDIDLNFDQGALIKAPCFDASQLFDASLPPEFFASFPRSKEDFDTQFVDFDFVFDEESWDTVLEDFEQENILLGTEAKSSTSFEQNTLVPLVMPEQYVAPAPKCVKRKRENINDTKLEHTKCLRKSNALDTDEGQVSIKSESIILDLFATPRSTWSLAKQNRYDAMLRLRAKRLKGRFGSKQNKKSRIRKTLANGRKRTRKGQFARTSKFTWVSACDLQ